ncbi:MAG TPA: hypothetical protein VIR78_04225 [Malonomonas sp.]
MKRKVLSGLVAVTFLFGMAGMVGATTLTSRINMDNGYQVYLSTSDTAAGVQFGAGNSWPTTFVNTTTLTSGMDYFLHVYGYDQGGPAGFLGEFSLSGTDHVFSNNLMTLLTNTVDWSGNGTGWADTKTALTGYGLNGVSPWGNRPEVSSSAT